MRKSLRFVLFYLFVSISPVLSPNLTAQTSTGQISGVVSDPTGAVIPGATVTILNPVSAYSRTATTDGAGRFNISNIPFNPYHLTVIMSGFASFVQDVVVTSSVAVNLNISLQVGAANNTVTVESAGDLLENDPTFHTDIDRKSFQKLPLESQSSSLISLITQSAPGVAADSNGLFHGLGDHASNSFSIDGQPITDQQSKVFSNELPTNAVQSLQVIEGAPPAEYGGKTSLVIQVNTRSGQGVTTPTGSISASYGSFGSTNGSFDVSYGGQNWGNFLEVDGLNTGRFLDPPEFTVFHSKGNEENIFDRSDRNLTAATSVHLNLNYSRSWFQTPNAFDNLNVQNVLSGGAGPDPVFGNVGNTDQRSEIETFNIAPSMTHVINNYSVFNFGAFVRKDAYSYFPSGNPLADLGPVNLQTSSVSQYRTLTNAGLHTDLSYVKGIQNIKVGANYGQTFLREYDSLGIVDNTYNSPCVNNTIDHTPVPGFSSPSQCAAFGFVSNDPSVNPAGTFKPVLEPYDLTRGGSLYHYFGHTDVKETALYAEDQIKPGNWIFSVGIRGDIYNGLTDASQAEPRVGISYAVQQTNSILSISYARTLETPFNENLVLSSQGCLNDVLAPLLSCTPGVIGILQPGFRNEFHASIQQAFGKHLVMNGEYIWKYTHNAFDFSVLGNTPITFPIEWHNAKVPGFALRTEVPEFHNFSAYVVMSSVAARFFPPQVAGAGATVGQPGYPFRIDHDEKFNETTNAQYQIPGKKYLAPWISFNWHFDSGLVAGAVPCYTPFSVDPNSPCGTPAAPTSTLLNGQPAVLLTSLNADEEFQAGLRCNGQRATPTSPLPPVCLASELTSNLVHIPAPNTGNADHNPQRVAPRSLFDASVGEDNLFRGDRYRWSLQLTAINISNKYALYNFLSTFSGTHYVTPRALTAQLALHF